MRLVCHLDNGEQTLLCVNNYRGKDYNKPMDSVYCKDCVFNPENKGKKVSRVDCDKIELNDYYEQETYRRAEERKKKKKGSIKRVNVILEFEK